MLEKASLPMSLNFQGHCVFNKTDFTPNGVFLTGSAALDLKNYFHTLSMN